MPTIHQNFPRKEFPDRKINMFTITKIRWIRHTKLFKLLKRNPSNIIIHAKLISSGIGRGFFIRTNVKGVSDYLLQRFDYLVLFY